MKPIHLFLALAIVAMCCVPVMAANVTYPQEYYDLGDRSWKLSVDNQMSLSDWRIYTATYYELRRQTILMEKQNELLAEQNELIGRLVNATEIKFECKATGYVKESQSYNLDYPQVDTKTPFYYEIDPEEFNTSNAFFKVDGAPCGNLTPSARAKYGCPS